tara:strand:- start:104 stop:274 length:171 start_codon:yes stop_codon:yes gene_type:complete
VENLQAATPMTGIMRKDGVELLLNKEEMLKEEKKIKVLNSSKKMNKDITNGIKVVF